MGARSSTFSTASMADASRSCVRVRNATRVAFTNGHVLITMGNAGALVKRDSGLAAMETEVNAVKHAHMATSREHTEPRIDACVVANRNYSQTNGVS